MVVVLALVPAQNRSDRGLAGDERFAEHCSTGFGGYAAVLVGLAGEYRFAEDCSIGSGDYAALLVGFVDTSTGRFPVALVHLANPVVLGCISSHQDHSYSPLASGRDRPLGVIVPVLLVRSRGLHSCHRIHRTDRHNSVLVPALLLLVVQD